MKPAVTRLFITAALFIAWMGYLGFQVVTRPQTATGAPLVLSRPQILGSQIDVIASVPDEKGEEVTIKEVLYPANAPLKPGDTIHVTNIRDCAALRTVGEKPAKDWAGPGDYLLPLRPLPGKNKYEVAPIPPSPGFFTADPRPRIYPANEAALAQYRHIAKPD
jgi:hypothetical protein